METCLCDVLERITVFENLRPDLYSRQAYFPGVVQLPSGDLLALFTVGQAFQSADRTTWVSRSTDLGRSWRLEGPLSRDSRQSLMKPTVLNNGSLIALGYAFRRDDPEEFLNAKTGGFPSGWNLVSFSQDEGKTWSVPARISLNRREVVEVSGPAVQVSSGDLLAAGALFPLWEGNRPSGNVGIVLRSQDGGRSWDDSIRFLSPTQQMSITPFESRLCVMRERRIIVLFWAFDEATGTSLNNHVVISDDDGLNWSEPIDTGIAAQASHLTYLGSDLLLAIHADREADIGLFVRLVDCSKNRWVIVSEQKIWEGSRGTRVEGLFTMRDLRFGQPSLLQLSDDDFLVVFWAIEEGQGRILSLRIRLARK